MNRILVGKPHEESKWRNKNTRIILKWMLYKHNVGILAGLNWCLPMNPQWLSDYIDKINSIVQVNSWKVGNCSRNNLLIRKKPLPQDHNLGCMNALHIITSYVFWDSLQYYYASILRLTKWLLLIRFSN